MSEVKIDSPTIRSAKDYLLQTSPKHRQVADLLDAYRRKHSDLDSKHPFATIKADLLDIEQKKPEIK
ncbi:hypothetical protein G6F37_010349 [Rhizopus arrhizus]|nr:hypothetical protein G6F38_010177 [Rhizopus arrhizus]KAG1153445.1 hypothetical protein G6F37_010349 [Rhizopus arrhizus]